MNPLSNQDSSVNQSEASNGPLPQSSLRLQRIDEYRQEALANPDALSANLGAVNSDLMRMAYRLMHVADEVLAQSANPLEEMSKLLPVIGVSAQFARQIQRYAEFDTRARAAHAGRADP